MRERGEERKGGKALGRDIRPAKRLYLCAFMKEGEGRGYRVCGGGDEGWEVWKRKKEAQRMGRDFTIHSLNQRERYSKQSR